MTKGEEIAGTFFNQQVTHGSFGKLSKAIDTAISDAHIKGYEKGLRDAIKRITDEHFKSAISDARRQMADEICGELNMVDDCFNRLDLAHMIHIVKRIAGGVG